MYEEHLKTREYCQKGSQTHKPTISVKSASSCGKYKKLVELSAIIKGTSTGLETTSKTKGASVLGNIKKPSPIEKALKLKELGKLVRG
jgi:hypothetical protein